MRVGQGRPEAGGKEYPECTMLVSVSPLWWPVGTPIHEGHCPLHTPSQSVSQSVQLLSRVRLLQPQGPQHSRPPCPPPTPGVYSLISIESVLPSHHLILCHPLLLPPSFFPSIRVFCNESAPHIRCPKYWSFSISPSNEYSGLISFRMDWLDLLAVQGTLKSLL